MKLKHSDIKTILEYCHERNWCKHEFPEEFIQGLKDEMATFPRGGTMGKINAWWYDDIEYDIPKELIKLIITAIHDNTAMEDSRLPITVLDKLKREQ